MRVGHPLRWHLRVVLVLIPLVVECMNNDIDELGMLGAGPSSLPTIRLTVRQVTRNQEHTQRW